MLSTLRAQLPKTPFSKVQSVVSFQRMVVFAGPGAASGSQQIPQPKEKTVPIRHYQPPISDTIHYRVPDANGKSTLKTTVVQSLMGGAQIFGKINALLDKAEKATAQGKPMPFVMTELYELQNRELYPERTCPPGTPGAEDHHRLLDRLINLHRSKQAEVRMILDQSKQQPRVLEPDPTKPLKDQPKVLMEATHNERTFKKLQEANIKVVAYPNEVTLKNHTKIFLLNNKHAVIAGMNWGNHSATNHDAGVYLKGPDVRNIFHQVYKPDWLTSNGDPADLPPIKPFHPGKIKVLQTSGKKSEQGAKDEVLAEILHQTQRAQSSIQAQLFVLTHKKVVNALLQKHYELIENHLKQIETSPVLAAKYNEFIKKQPACLVQKTKPLSETIQRIQKDPELMRVQPELIQKFSRFLKTQYPGILANYPAFQTEGQVGVQLLVDEGLANVFPNCQPGIKKLDDAGVPIRLFKEDITNEEKLHAKWVVFDRKTLLEGSPNWSSLGLDSKGGTHSDPVDFSDDEAGRTLSKIPYKTNHEIALLIQDAPNVAENFAKQADHDFNYQPGVPSKDQLSIPVSWRKWDQSKPWKDQRYPTSSWKKPNWRPSSPKVNEASAQPAAEGKRNAASVPNESGSPRAKRSKTDVAS